MVARPRRSAPAGARPAQGARLAGVSASTLPTAPRQPHAELLPPLETTNAASWDNPAGWSIVHLIVLTHRAWELKYTPDDGDLVEAFYVPALQNAARYDRLTGYLDAGALALAACGVDGLVRNDGRMRMVVGCTLAPQRPTPISGSEALRDLRRAAPRRTALGAARLRSGRGAEVGRVDDRPQPPRSEGRGSLRRGRTAGERHGDLPREIGLIEDRAGYKIAWTGSLNETAAGWRRNWESINVYRSRGPELEGVAGEERNFARLWVNRSPRAVLLNVPDAARQDLLRFLPPDLPARMKATTPPPAPPDWSGPAASARNDGQVRLRYDPTRGLKLSSR